MASNVLIVVVVVDEAQETVIEAAIITSDMDAPAVNTRV
jgi:hypothetical protein